MTAIKQIRLSQKSKERLSRLKGKTGIMNWNILCRWAFCYSISIDSVPPDEKVLEYSNVEMSFYTFGGEFSTLYEALLENWIREHGIEVTNKNMNRYLHLHIERGIAYLSRTGFIKDITDLLNLGNVTEEGNI